MLSSFRRLSKSKFGTGILVVFMLLVVASFAVADMGNFNIGGGGGGTLAEAGDEQVTEREYSSAMERLLASARQQNPEVTYASLNRDAPAVLEQLIDEAALKSFANDHGLILSKRLIDAQIASLPATRGLDGKFSEAA